MKSLVSKILLLALMSQSTHPLFGEEGTKKKSFFQRINPFKRKNKETPSTTIPPTLAPSKKEKITKPAPKAAVVPEDTLTDDQGFPQPPGIDGYYEKTTKPQTIYNKTNKTAYTLTNGKWIPSDLDGNVTPPEVLGIFKQTEDPKIIVNQNDKTAYKLNNGKWIAGIYQDGLFAIRAQKLEEASPIKELTIPPPSTRQIPSPQSEKLVTREPPITETEEIMGPPEKVDYYRTKYQITYPELVKPEEKKDKDQSFYAYGAGVGVIALLTMGGKVLAQRYDRNLQQRHLSGLLVDTSRDYVRRDKAGPYENPGSTLALNYQRSQRELRIHLSECRLLLRR